MIWRRRRFVESGGDGLNLDSIISKSLMREVRNGTFSKSISVNSLKSSKTALKRSDVNLLVFSSVRYVIDAIISKHNWTIYDTEDDGYTIRPKKSDAEDAIFIEFSSPNYDKLTIYSGRSASFNTPHKRFSECQSIYEYVENTLSSINNAITNSLVPVIENLNKIFSGADLDEELDKLISQIEDAYARYKSLCNKYIDLGGDESDIDVAIQNINKVM